MKTDKRTTKAGASAERCDIKTWSGECEHTPGSSKYLCATCGTIVDLNHEMRHDTFPYMSGDTDNLS